VSGEFSGKPACSNALKSIAKAIGTRVLKYPRPEVPTLHSSHTNDYSSTCRACRTGPVSAMSSESWLFVNDNPDSATKDKTRKQPEKAVKAHVQNVAFRKKRKERIDRLRRPSIWPKPVLPRPNTSAPEQAQGKGDARDEPVRPLKFGPILTPKSLGKSDEDGEEELGWLPHEGIATSTGRITPLSSNTSSALVRTRSPFTESVSPLGADRFDPFATYPIKLQKIDDAFLEQC
jgi:hypothetical protein